MRGAHMSRVRVELGVYEGGADHRIILETMEVPKREHEAESNEDRGGNQTLEPQTRNVSIIQKMNGAR